jgi:hypothetical protein
MPAPTIDPDRRDPAGIAPADSYRPADAVWIHRGGRWCPGVIESASARAATVTYRPTDAGGTSVETLTAECLLHRDDLDPILDRRASRPLVLDVRVAQVPATQW